MKIQIITALALLLIFTGCTKDFDDFLEEWGIEAYKNNVCETTTDAIYFPDHWTLEDYDSFYASNADTFQYMSACGLWETLFNQSTAYYWWTTRYYLSSNSFMPLITYFNDELETIPPAVELFEREDCYSILISKYIEFNTKPKEIEMYLDYFFLFLASDMCMEALNEKEKVTLMALNLQKNGIGDKYVYQCLPLTVAIMRSCNYAPFMENVNGHLREATFLYVNIHKHIDDIQYYAKKFLNDKK